MEMVVAIATRHVFGIVPHSFGFRRVASQVTISTLFGYGSGQEVDIPLVLPLQCHYIILSTVCRFTDSKAA